MTDETVTIGSLCTGYGGLDLAAERLTGGSTVWTAENDRHAARVAAERFPSAPNLGDLTDHRFDPEPVDIVTAGFPCQPVSDAGRRRHTNDERWIWPDIVRVIRRMDPPPRMLMFENVPGLLTVNSGDAMADVVSDMADLGYMGSFRTLAASDIGLCHRRRRLFIVAVREPDDVTLIDPAEILDDAVRVADHGELLPTPTATYPGGTREQYAARLTDFDGRTVGWGGSLTWIGELLPTPTATDAKGSRRRSAATDQWESNDGVTLTDVAYTDTFGRYAAAIERHAAAVGTDPPPPTVDGRLSPRFVEWMLALDAGWVTDVDVPRTAQLRILGNGVAPIHATTGLAAAAADVADLAHYQRNRP